MRRYRLVNAQSKLVNVPKLAKVVIKDIRKNIKKPKTLPFPPNSITNTCLRWRIKHRFYCPLGFYPGLDFTKSCGGFSPGKRSAIPKKAKFNSKQFKSFIHWWDKQTNPEEAVKAVWG